MFDSHPQIAIPGETYFISKLLPRRHVYESNGFDIALFMNDVMTLSWTKREDVTTWVDMWGMDRDLLLEKVTQAHPRDYPDAVRAVYRAYADWKGKSIYGDKTPAYITSMDQIAALLPEARFVHLVRDGRNVALAFLDAPFGPWTIEEIALHWRSRTRAGRESGERLGPSRYTEVRYEDLVEQPENALTQICAWLGVPFYSEMLDHRGSAKGILYQKEQAHQSVLRPVTKNVRDWRTSMDQNVLGRFELIAGDTLEEFGYQRSGIKLGSAGVTASAYRRMYLEGKKLFRRMRGLNSAEWW